MPYLIIVATRMTYLEVYKSAASSVDNITIEEAIAEAVKRAGGDASDYIGVKISDINTINRIKNEDDFILLPDAENGFIVDFSQEDSKLWFNVKANESYIVRDGSSVLPITGEILLADQSGVDISFNGEILIPLLTPSHRIIKLKAKFTNGICQHDFMPEELGIYLMTSEDIRIGNYRVLNNIIIESILSIG